MENFQGDAGTGIRRARRDLAQVPDTGHRGPVTVKGRRTDREIDENITPHLRRVATEKIVLAVTHPGPKWLPLVLFQHLEEQILLKRRAREPGGMDLYQGVLREKGVDLRLVRPRTLLQVDTD